MGYNARDKPRFQAAEPAPEKTELGYLAKLVIRVVFTVNCWKFCLINFLYSAKQQTLIALDKIVNVVGVIIRCQQA